jgi:hypothetical protein
MSDNEIDSSLMEIFISELFFMENMKSRKSVGHFRGDDEHALSFLSYPSLPLSPLFLLISLLSCQFNWWLGRAPRAPSVRSDGEAPVAGDFDLFSANEKHLSGNT